ncbi:flagellar biosynthesis protein FlgB [Clostridioides difficile]|nr:flagellar basal body rod protein FlgB [Clostridioides difficile]EHJ29967.1 putative flagellar basal-body rod protein FlgB [Clostridioides difficile 050-P50-2011]EHJ34653.1 putative flagellar basal-body rod protein FlgB [Clostridioides difficile 002-P50-2011]EQG24195.1 flagellar basal-body rod protein FlgB [Clostridioides difficile DA00065]PBD87056.1 flagellar biosynthesis protein FlgB [Clostridioides difficile]PBE46936.1 flagellar biosynthesis protein FlgB [Clostridioides difficile]
MGLDATNLRSQTIANNIANINTEGYKRHYITFEETLNDTMPKIEEKTDNSKGLRVDGNNVDIEEEKVNQAMATLQYNALISFANGKIAMTKSIISGR